MSPFTTLEQRILDNLVAGVVTDCRAADGSRQQLAGQFIRDLLRGVVDRLLTPDPLGLCISGAEIRGQLDLRYLSTKIRLSLSDCTSSDPIWADYAHLESLSLKECRWDTSGQGAFSGAGLAVKNEVEFDGFAGTSTGGDTIRLIGASIGGTLSFNGARLVSDTGTSLDATAISVAFGMSCDEKFRASSISGTAVRLVRATVGGALSFNGAHLRSNTGSALDARSLTASTVDCNHGFEATSKGGAAVLLSGANIEALSFSGGAHLVSTEQTALDASHIKVTTSMHCASGFEAESTGGSAVRMLEAEVGGALNFTGAQLASDKGVALQAYGLRVTSTMLCNELKATSVSGNAVELDGASIGGLVSFIDACLVSETGVALQAHHLRVSSSVLFTGKFKATSSGASAVQLSYAKIGGMLSFIGAHLVGGGGAALVAFGVNVTDDMTCKGFVATANGGPAVALMGATIGRFLTLSGANLISDHGTALEASGLVVGYSMLCNEEFKATSTSGNAAVLNNANIGGVLSFTDACLLSDTGFALQAQGLHVSSSMQCGGKFKATSSSGGAVQLPYANIGGMLSFSGAHLVGGGGPALYAHGLNVTHDMTCTNGFNATARGGSAVTLAGANIGRILTFSGAKLVSDTGAALEASGLVVGFSMHCSDGFTATSTSGSAVALPGARIGNSLLFGAGLLHSDTGTGLHASRITVGSNMFCNNGFEASVTGTNVGVLLSGANILGSLELVPGSKGGPCVTSLNLEGASVDSLWLEFGFGPRSKRWFNADGLSYQHIPRGMSTDQWIECLKDQTTRFAMQPWRQLAATYTASGRDVEARKVLIAQQTYHRQSLKAQPTDSRRRKASALSRQVVSWIIGRATGYGYQTWRAAMGLVMVVVLSVGLSLASGHIHANIPGPGEYVAEHLAPAGEEGKPCTKAERLALGVQIGLPLIKLAGGDRCGLNSKAVAGQLITGLSWILQFLGWAFATLVVAGYTGIIRRL
jgi:hypothetical protein